MTDIFKKKESDDISHSLDHRVSKLEKDMAALKAANNHLFHCEEESEVESSGVVTGDEADKA
jgi:hypothetical protein